MVVMKVTAETGREEAERIQAEFDALPKCPVCGIAHQSDGPVLSCVLCGLSVTPRQAEYLRWVADKSDGWPTAYLPKGVPASESMIDRRVLILAELMCFVDSPSDPRQQLTDAGKRLVDSLPATPLFVPESPVSIPLPAPQVDRPAAPLTVEVSEGRYPVYYLTVPGDGGDPRMVLATLNSAYNPRAAEDALLFAAAGQLKRLLADLVDAITDKNTVTRGAVVCEAVRLLEQLG